MYVDILILAQLSSGPKYGYEIKKNVQNIFGSGFKINNNMLYPAIKKFEEMGAIQKKVEVQEGKPNRHMYFITKPGLSILQEILCEFPLEMASNDVEFQVRVSLFDMLDFNARKDILNKRTQVLERGLRHLEDVLEKGMLEKKVTFASRVIELHKNKIIQELNWILDIAKESGDYNK